LTDPAAPSTAPAGARDRPAPDRAALFLDFDGTLAPIVARPADARLPAASRGELERLARACGGALAVVSGRSLAGLDAMLAPLVLPAAGLHGAEWRGADGAQARLALDAGPVESIEQALQPYARAHPGVLLERKPLALAVHFRAAPDLAREIEDMLAALLRPHAQAYALQAGKMVLEVKPRAASKGEAIRRFMRAAPFAGRTPVFAGDDLTDESGFAAVNDMGGLSIKIGEGETAARLRLPGTDALAQWLAAWR